MNPLDRLRYNRRQRLENLAGILIPWLITLVGFLGAHLLIDETTRHDRVLHLATIQTLVFPVVIAYLIQLTSIRRFENLLRRIPWEEMRLTLLTGREIYQWAIGRYSLHHVIAFVVTFILVWTAILLDSWEVVAKFPLVLLLLAGFAGTPVLIFISLNIGFHHLLRPGVGYFRARLLALMSLILRWLLFLGSMALIWFLFDMISYMGEQMIHTPAGWVVGVVQVLLWVLLFVVIVVMAGFLGRMIRASPVVVESFDRALHEEW